MVDGEAVGQTATTALKVAAEEQEMVANVKIPNGAISADKRVKMRAKVRKCGEKKKKRNNAAVEDEDEDKKQTEGEGDKDATESGRRDQSRTKNGNSKKEGKNKKDKSKKKDDMEKIEVKHYLMAKRLKINLWCCNFSSTG